MKVRNFLALTSSDKDLPILGIIFSVILIIYLSLNSGRLVYVTVGILALVSCVIWLFIRQKASLNNIYLQSKSVYLALNVFFFLLLVCVILSLHFRENLYERPLIYFIFLSIMSGILALEILFVHPKKGNLALVLFQIVILALILVWSQLLIFPGIVGVDPWFHQSFTLKILDAGGIPDIYSYSKLPLMHLEIGSTSLITGLNYKLSTMLSITFLQVLCGIFFVFLIGRFIFNKKVGLLTGLLLAVGNHFINMGFWTIPNTIAAILIPIIIYLLFKFNEENHFIGIFLVVLSMMALTLTHTIAAMCMAIILFASWLSLKSYDIIYHRHRKIPIPFTIVTFFSVIMFSWWSYASGHMKTLIDLIKWGFNPNIFANVNVPIEILEYMNTVPILEQLFNQLGMFLFFSLSFIGCFYMLSERHSNSNTFTMVVAGFFPLAIGFLALITGHSVIQERWWYFGQILLALPLAITFLLLCSSIKNKFAKSFSLFTLTIFLSFIMIMSPTANIDNHSFSPNTGIRAAPTEAELITATFFVQNSAGNLSSDYDYFTQRSSSIPSNYYGMNYSRIKSLDECLHTGEFEHNRSIIVIREEIVNNPFRIYGQPFKLNYNPKQSLNEQYFSKIYECGSVSGFV